MNSPGSRRPRSWSWMSKRVRHFSTRLSHLDNGQHRALLWVKWRDCGALFEGFRLWIQFLGIDRCPRDHFLHHSLAVELLGVVVFWHLDLDFPAGGENWLREPGTESTSHRISVVVFWLGSLSWFLLFHWEALVEVGDDMVTPLDSHGQFKPMDTLNLVKYLKLWDTSDQLNHLRMCHHCHQNAFHLKYVKKKRNEGRDLRNRERGGKGNETKQGKRKNEKKTMKEEKQTTRGKRKRRIKRGKPEREHPQPSTRTVRQECPGQEPETNMFEI